MSARRVPRWYSKHTACTSEPSDIERTQRTLRVMVFRELIERSAVVDVTRPLEQFMTVDPNDSDRVLIAARVGVLVDPEDATEWDLDDWLALMVKVDDRVTAGFDDDARAHGHADSHAWTNDMERLQCRVATRVEMLQANTARKTAGH